MRLSRPVALLVAVFTLAPWVFFIVLFTYFARHFPTNPTTAAAPPDEFFENFNTIFRLQLLFMALWVALLAFYIVHVFRTDRVPADKKALWAVVLFLGNFLAMPVYWYLYMWPKAEEGEQPGT